jgi:ABC-type histidine transport system ATPase subunit
MIYEEVFRALNKNNVQYAVAGGVAVVFSFFNLRDHLKLIDVFITEPIKLRNVFKKLERVKVKKLTIPIVCISHLKKLKQISCRQQDLVDVRNLREIQRLRNGQDKRGE